MRPAEAAAAGERAAQAGPVRVLFIGGLGRSGSTLLDRALGQLDGVWSVGELVHVWQRGLEENNLCGCGRRFRDCAFWRLVGEVAFGGWDTLDVGEVLALKRAVDRNRYVPLMVLPALWPPYRARLRRYLGLLERLYAAVRQVADAPPEVRSSTHGAHAIGALSAQHEPMRRRYSTGPLLVDASKHASHAFLLRRLQGVELRLVHLVRDSRGVAFSWTKPMRRREVVGGDALMATDTPLRMSARYLAYNSLFHLLDRLGVATLLLRYESLVHQPARQLRRVLAHAGRPAADGELGFVGDGWIELDTSHALAGNPMRFERGRVPLRLDEEWRGKLPRRQRLLTVGSTWPLLLRYGYLRGHR
jgi:Sulfotransferase domain